VLEINRNRAADAAGGLIKQSAGFTEIDIFRVLANLCNLDRGESEIVELTVEDRTDDYFESRRRGQAASPQNIAGGIGIETGSLSAQLTDPSRNTTNQRAAAPLFPLDDPVL